MSMISPNSTPRSLNSPNNDYECKGQIENKEQEWPGKNTRKYKNNIKNLLDKVRSSKAQPNDCVIGVRGEELTYRVTLWDRIQFFINNECCNIFDDEENILKKINKTPANISMLATIDCHAFMFDGKLDKYARAKHLTVQDLEDIYRLIEENRSKMNKKL
jgi:hypothetical protein